MNNGLIGQVHLLSSNNPAWLTYSTQNKTWNGTLVPLSTSALLFETMQGNLEITTKESGGYWDQKGNWIVTKEKVTGKVSVALNSTTSDEVIGDFTSNVTTFMLINQDEDSGEYVQDAILNFTTVGKIGELIISEMSFEFDQATKIPVANSRRRLFGIVSVA